jgi:DNA topoisomerase 2-associated protein PAT1
MGGPETTKAVSREMPVELLRASIPYTNEQHRQTLLDFAQKSTHLPGFSPTANSGLVNSESVPG